MFKLLGRIFGTEKAIESTISAARDGLDALVYTDEEKAQDAAKDRSEARGMIVQWMAATQGQNLARRFLAMVITAVWLLQYLASLVLSCAIVFIDDKILSGKLSDVVIIIGERAESMNGAMMLILGFYFAAPHMGSIAKAAMSKFSGSK